jgi:hypothetical protein
MSDDSRGVGVILTLGGAIPMPPELTEDVIAAAMARAEKVACRPGEGRCYALPDPVATARHGLASP